jgi:hypothetical protein
MRLQDRYRLVLPFDSYSVLKKTQIKLIEVARSITDQSRPGDGSKKKAAVIDRNDRQPLSSS